MKCKYHPDRESTHMVDVGIQFYECDECAAAEREIGALRVTPIAEEEDVLDAEFVS